MYCLTDNGGGSFSVANPQPTDINTCVYVIAQPAEVQPALWAMTAEQGTTIGTAIMLVWAIAWGFRAVIRVLSTDDSQNYERE